MAIVTGTGVASSGALAYETPASSTAGTESDWEPKDVPYGMETPWYDDVSPENSHTKYPRPQMVRDEWRNLNGIWEFASASKGDSPPIDGGLDEVILVPFPPESSLSGIQRHESRMWYRKTFSVPNEWLIPTAHPGDGVRRNPNSQRLLLHFERVDWETTVYINGEKVTTHKGGYDSFTVDITDYLTNRDEQEVVVGVYDPTDTGTQPVGKQEIEQDRDIFFTPSSGIWDTVWLEPVPEARINKLDTTPDLTNDSLRLTVDANTDDARVVATAYTSENEEEEEKGDFDDRDQIGHIVGPTNQELELSVPNPHLWSPNEPFLYDLEVELRQKNTYGNDEEEQDDVGGKQLDMVESYFGMRSFGKKSIKGIPRPTLNGEFVFHNGIYDQGYWPDGIYTPPADEARRFDLQLAKELGYNAYRKHLKIPSKRWYYWADKLGLLVWQDIPNQPLGQPVANENTQKQFRTELREMITENDNHPSLAVWIPVNEGWGHGKTNYDRIRSTTKFVEDIDDERLIDSLSGIDTMFVDGEIDGDMIDYHNYGRVTPIPEPTDEQMSVVGESAAGWTPINGHQWDDGNPTGNTPEVLVQNLIDRAENNSRYMTSDGLSAAINLQVTDTEFHYQGVVTYDRRVFKPELVSNDAVERIKTANEAMIESSKQIEQGPYLSVEAPPSYSPDEELFEIVGTFTNPKREESGNFDLSNVKLDVTQLPDGIDSRSQTTTTFDSIKEGESVTVRWKLVTDAVETPDLGVDEFTVEVTFNGPDGTTTLEETRGFEIEPVEPIPAGFWPFDDGNGDTATDEVANNDGTLIGDPTWTDGKVGAALAFDGVGDYIDTSANVLDTTEDYSVAAWVKLDDIEGFQTAISQVMGDGTAFFLQYLGLEDQFSFSFFGGRAFGGPTVEAGKWYHVGGVHDTYEGRAKLYVDGKQVAAIDCAPTESGGNLLIGRATVGSNAVDFWNGTIDQVRAYQSSLDDEAVRDLYESGL